MPLALDESFLSLGAALAAGLVIGFERQQSAPRDPERAESMLGGARTYPLFALVGGVSALLSTAFGVGALIVSLLSVTALLALHYRKDLERGSPGLTSEAALLLTFLLGALACSEAVLEPASQRALLVLSLSVVATLLLSVKGTLHRFIERVSTEDVFATLKFLIVAVVVLPLLPDVTVGPLDVLNPRKIGLMVTLIAGMSFVGYLAIRLLGVRRGLGVTGLVGGLVSSTAVTMTFSGRAKAEPSLARSCALAIMLASSIMFARVLVTVAIVNRDLLPTLLVPMGGMAVAGLLLSAWFFRHSQRGPKSDVEVKFSNPMELSSAVKFAAIYALVLLVTKAATTWFGQGATYLTGVLAGATDVDAITLSMASLVADGMPKEVGVTTIILAAASNTVVKGAMAVTLGGWAFGRQIAVAFGIVIAVGAASVAFVWLG